MSHASPLQIKGDGSCQLRAIWAQLQFPDDTDGVGAMDCDTDTAKEFTPYRLRLMAVYLMIQRADLVGVIAIVQDI